VDRDALLAEFDRRFRGHVPTDLPDGVVVDRDGPLVRYTSFSFGGFVEPSGPDALAGVELDALIARQIEHYGARGESFEWKTYAHDLRGDELIERLAAAGFVPQEPETVVVAPVAELPRESPPPEGVVLRDVSERADLEAIDRLHEAVWGEREHAPLSGDLEAELAATPEDFVVTVAEAAGEVVSAGWIRIDAGSGFAGLYGGSTLAEWRRRGIYRALVARRARLAAERGVDYLEVDASEDSRPILERLGFVAITTTTPFIWSP
jgi:hypothetical protein